MPGGCSRSACSGCSSPRSPGARSSRAWPPPRCCCSRRAGSSGGRRGSRSRASPAPGGPSRTSWWPWTWWPWTWWPGPGAQDAGECTVRWLLHPGQEIEPGRRRHGRRAGGPLHRQPAPVGSARAGHHRRAAARPLAAGRGTPDPYPAQDRLLPGSGPPADPGGAQQAPQPARGAPGPGVRRGDRVRRGARVRAGRPPAQHQLGGQHQARAAAGEHLRGRAFPGRGAAGRRHLRRRRAGVVRPGPGAARRGGRGPRLPGGQGPGGRDHLPVGLGDLAATRAGPPAGVPDHRLHAGQRRRLHRIRAGRTRRELQPAAAGRAAARRPGHRVQPAA